ncbi:MAG TPA: alpha-galactosidase [Gryllotalpicola sp.]
MSAQTVRISNGHLGLEVGVTVDGVVALTGVTAGDGDGIVVERAQPLVEILVLGEGHSLTNTRLTHTAVGRRLRYVSHEISRVGTEQHLAITQADPQTGLQATSRFVIADGVPALRSWTEVTATDQDVILQAVSSFAASAFLRPGESADAVDMLQARSEWCGESRWSRRPLRGADGLIDIDTVFHDHESRGMLGTTSTSTWSSGEFLPTGVLANRRSGYAWAWQIEHNGAWRWELDSLGEAENAVVLVLSGPTDLHHQWTHRLSPGDTFATVPVSIAVSNAGSDGAFAALTSQRRAIRRHRAVDAGLPLIFNDYMNTLMGDPTTEKLTPLIDAAAAVGAEYFCIDAGWYDDSGAWWDSVGEWQPSHSRFPGGLGRVLDHIRERGMMPGLWLEPEVIGVRSSLADRLPPEAFLQRSGQRVVEHSRYHLDLRHPAARAHLDEVIDRAVDQWGVRYFKLDYNVTPGAGTDHDAFSVGDGLLQHNRAHLEWLDGVLDRHPDVIFENCSSGAMRMDYAMMSRLDLQSTSDQQNFALYPAIAAAAPASLVPEQAGNWAYPSAEMSEEETAFAMMNGMLGRLYLSGHLDLLEGAGLALVREAVDINKSYRGLLDTATPFWPVGLPGWTDDTIVLGLDTREGGLLAVWHRGDAREIELTLPPAYAGASVETVYPARLADWRPELSGGTTLRLRPAQAMSARLLRLTRA